MTALMNSTKNLGRNTTNSTEILSENSEEETFSNSLWSWHYPDINIKRRKSMKVTNQYLLWA